MHDIARKHIKQGFKLTKGAKNEVVLSLVEDYHIPLFAIERMPHFDILYANTMLYVSDGIAFNMVPEQIVKYSDYFFGTVDAITSLDYVLKKKELRIHDLKTGTTPAQMRQLEIYAAEYFLEHSMLEIRPEETMVELRIYQGNEILFHKPTVDELYFWMDFIKTIDTAVHNLHSKEA